MTSPAPPRVEPSSAPSRQPSEERPPLDERAPAKARVVWTLDARRKLLPRRREPEPASSRVYKPGLLAELSALGRRAIEEPHDAPISGRASAAWREMRRLLAAADADTYAAARAAVARMREGAPLTLRCLTAYAFATEAAWSRDDAITCVDLAASGEPVPACAALLFASITDADLALRLLRAFPASAPRIVIASSSLELVESIGPGASIVLTALLDDLTASKETEGLAVRCFEALELIQSDDIAAAFARHLDANDVRPYAARYFQAAPRLAVKALAPLASGRGRAAEAAKTLLFSAVASSPSLVSSLLPELGVAARRGVKAAIDRAEAPGEEASPDELPAVLVTPPWREKASRRARFIENLAVLDERPPEWADPGARDAWAITIHWVPNSLVLSPRVALPVAHAWIHAPSDRGAADAWLTAFPEAAALGLIPAAVGNPGAQRTDAGRILRLLAGRGRAPAIRAAAARYGVEVALIVDEVLALDPILDCPESPPKLPDFLRVEALPRPRLAASSKVLPLRAVHYVCEMLAFSSDDFPYAGIAALRAACDKASLSELAWAIVAAWLAAGGSMKKYAWPLRGLAELGGDEGARRLAPKIRAWADEKAIGRAEAGVDALARIGTDVALMRLSAVAQTSRFPDLQRYARAKIAAVAAHRGLSPDELADRLVPDLDLDRDGSMVLDYGPRSFRVGFDEHLEPFVRDDAGFDLAALPRPTKTDDPEKSRAALSTWKGLRDDAEVIAKGQIHRLELAMATRRRWTPEELRAFLIDHPLMVHLARRLVWGAFDATGRLVATFRVAEDRTLADADDAPYEAPSGGLRFGLPHPLDLSADRIAVWGGILADYAIVQPFEQLGRAVFTLTDAERASSVLRRVEGVRVPTRKIFGVLEHRGWVREAEIDDVVHVYSKDLALSRHVALLEIDPGVRLARLNEAPEQTLGVISLMRDRTLSIRSNFSELDPLIASELLRDVERLRS